MSEDDEMYVTKRNGERENVAFDKILRRIKTIGKDVDIKINYSSLAMKVIDQLYSGISTTKIDEIDVESNKNKKEFKKIYLYRTKNKKKRRDFN